MDGAPLCVVPTYVRGASELEVVGTTLRTLREHEPDAPVLVVDDGSPSRAMVEGLRAACLESGCELAEKAVNSGFPSTVNVGLREALERGLDAVLVNADIEFTMPFAGTFRAREDSRGRPAAVVGALLLYSSGMIQHAGVYFSFFSRAFDHRYRYGPGALPEAQQPAVCPVTGALQFIRHSTLEAVGLYDEDEFRMGFEDVDYCLRVFDADLECVYEPAVVAIHHESLFRGQRSEKLDEWHQASLEALHRKHGQTPLGRFVPPIT